MVQVRSPSSFSPFLPPSLRSTVTAKMHFWPFTHTPPFLLPSLPPSLPPLGRPRSGRLGQSEGNVRYCDYCSYVCGPATHQGEGGREGGREGGEGWWCSEKRKGEGGREGGREEGVDGLVKVKGTSDISPYCSRVCGPETYQGEGGREGGREGISRKSKRALLTALHPPSPPPFLLLLRVLKDPSVPSL